MGTDGWTQPTTIEEFFRQTEKRLLRGERRVEPTSAEDLLGPGIQAQAIELLDWNSEEATFNGFYYSKEGAINSPDSDVNWIGVVVAQDDNNGVQQVYEGQPPEGEEVIPPADPPANPPTMGDPEPETPTTGNETPVRHYIRYYSTSPEELTTFTEWVSAGSGGGGALAELRDVHIFEPILHHDVLLYNADYNGGAGAWVNYPFIPGIAPLQASVQDALNDAADAIAIAETATRVYRQNDAPVPGAAGVPDPLGEGAIWFDTDDGNHMRTWDGSAWVEVDSIIFANLTASAAAASAAASTATTNAANAITAANNIASLSTTIQTEPTASRGIKFNSTGLVAYNTSGVATFTMLASTGSVALLGDLVSGSTVSGATITGGLIQTESTVSRGLKLTSGGLVAYDAGGVPSFTITASTGAVSMKGSLVAGSDINGATITGGVVQSSANPNTGIKFNSTGLVAYDSAGQPTLTVLASSGALTMRGTLLSGSNVIGATIAGSVVSTSPVTTASNYLNNNADRVQLRDDNNAGVIEFFSGNTGVPRTGRINCSFDTFNIDGGLRPRLRMFPTMGTNGFTPFLELAGLSQSGGLYGTYARLSGEDVIINSQNRVVVPNGLACTGGGLYVNGGSTLNGGVTISGATSANAITSTGAITAGGLVTGNGLTSTDMIGTGGAQTCLVGNGGKLQRSSSSSRKIKKNIKPLDLNAARTALDLEAVSFQYRDEEFYGTVRYPGFIAEQADEVGADLWVYREDGKPTGIRYAELTAAHNMLIADLEKRLVALTEQVAALTK